MAPENIPKPLVNSSASTIETKEYNGHLGALHNPDTLRKSKSLTKITWMTGLNNTPSRARQPPRKSCQTIVRSWLKTEGPTVSSLK